MRLSTYLPGDADTATAVFLHKILSGKIAEALKKEILELDREKTKVEGVNLFWNKWRVANIISTALKNGSYIDTELMEKAREYYEYCLNTKELEKYCPYTTDVFRKEVSLVLRKMKKMQPKKNQNGMMYYAPDFLSSSHAYYIGLLLAFLCGAYFF